MQKFWISPEVNNDDKTQKIQQKPEEIMKRGTLPKQQSGSEPTREPIILTDSSFFPELSRHALMVVDFWAPWCDPCKLVSPIIDELAREYAGRVVFGKLNIDDNPIVSDGLGVENIPTILVFKQRKQVDGLIGEAEKSSIENMFKPYLENDNSGKVA